MTPFKIVLACSAAVSLIVINSCGTKDSKKETPAASYEWAPTIGPIVAATCSGGGTCHGASESNVNKYVEKKIFIASAASIKAELNASRMPKADPGPGTKAKALSADDKAKLLAYLDQTTKN